MKIVLIGASGFFGEYLLRGLVRDRHRCLVLTRSITRRSNLRLLPGVSLEQADVYDKDILAEKISGADAVVSMAGILNETEKKGRGFRKVHVELIKGIIEACQKSGVSRLLHVSALNAGKGKSQYLETKGEAERLLLGADDLNVSIFQPSVIFGPGDQFFNRFASMLKLMPVMPLACPSAKLQPVYAGDVAAAMLAALDDPMTWGKRFELAGPRVYTLKELVNLTSSMLGRRSLVLGLPGPISALMAKVMDHVPGKPFSWDNYQSLQTDNVSSSNGFAYFGIEPRAIDMEVPYYLRGSEHQRKLGKYRRQQSR